MAKAMTAWGIDIGQCAMKAIKLVDYGDALEVEDFAVIEHPEVLSQPEVDRAGLIRQAMEQFLSSHEIKGSSVVVSVPGQSSFTRFFKPPPVEPKELPRIVQYEAAQQIPFAIDEVVWRWQAFQEPDSPDIEVGIFAMKRVDIAETLGHLTDVGIRADIVQIAPLALYNFLSIDGQRAGDGATLLVDVGADKTDLVVADGARIWNRTIQIGGSNFTEALARAFKLSFAKAEKLKRTAATSKYARQVFQAMRPVFEDLVQEMQRSVGYYISLHRESRFKKLLGLGNGFRLPGLQKFLEQNLNIPVARLDGLKNLQFSRAINVPQFQENTLSFGVAYGLAAQALRPAPVVTNLLPEEIARRRLWRTKAPWFVTAGVLVLLALACPVLRAYWDSRALPREKDNPAVLAEARDTVRELDALKKEYRKVINEGKKEQAQTQTYLGMFDYRDFWPSLEALVIDSFLRITKDADGALLQAKLQAYVDAPAESRSSLEAEWRSAALPGREQEIASLLEKYVADEAARAETLTQLADMVLLPESRNVQRLIELMSESSNYDRQKQILDRIHGIPRQDRRVFFLERLDHTYTADLRPMMPESERSSQPGGLNRGFRVVLQGRTPLNLPEALAALDRLKKVITQEVEQEVNEKGKSALGEETATEVLKVLYCDHKAETATPRAGTGTALAMPDTLFPDENAAGDTRFTVTWLVAVVEKKKESDSQTPGGSRQGDEAGE